MANYTALCRSNYVQARDNNALSEFFSSFSEMEILEKDGRLGFICHDGMPHREDEDGENRVSILALAKELGALMAEDEILVIKEIGSERLRYLIGGAIAIHSSGEFCSLSLCDIYKRASDAFGVDLDRISACAF